MQVYVPMPRGLKINCRLHLNAHRRLSGVLYLHYDDKTYRSDSNAFIVRSTESVARDLQ